MHGGGGGGGEAGCLGGEALVCMEDEIIAIR